MTEPTKPILKSNWVRLLHYMVVVFIISMIVFIPIVIFVKAFGYWDIYEGPHPENWMSFINGLGICLAFCLATYNMVVKTEHRKMNQYLITGSLRAAVSGFVVGTAMLGSFGLLSFSFGFIDFRFSDITNQVILDFIFFFLVALAEEVMFRGYILTNLREKLSNTQALIVSSLLFGAAHLGNDHITLIGFLTISLSGLLMGQVALLSGTISSAIGLHWAWNFIQSILSLSVSGMEQTGIFKPEFHSVPKITGGDFGAEGSVLMLAIVTMAIIVVARYPRILFNPISLPILR